LWLRTRALIERMCANMGRVSTYILSSLSSWQPVGQHSLSHRFIKPGNRHMSRALSRVPVLVLFILQIAVTIVIAIIYCYFNVNIIDGTVFYLPRITCNYNRLRVVQGTSPTNSSYQTMRKQLPGHYAEPPVRFCRLTLLLSRSNLDKVNIKLISGSFTTRKRLPKSISTVDQVVDLSTYRTARF
jgi:hypothetical protein